MVIAAMQNRFQKWQDSASARNAGHLGIAIAGALMLFVACPMNAVAVAAPYWTGSQAAQGATISYKTSLWTASTVFESGSSVQDQQVDLCGDEKPNQSINNGCSRIRAVRIFQCSALLLALASAFILLVAFSPALKANRALRPKFYIIGACFASLTFVCNFASVCLVSSIAVPKSTSLSGTGFVFLVLSLWLTVVAMVSIALVLRSEPPPPTQVSSLGAWTEKSSPSAATNEKHSGEKMPKLLGRQPSGKQLGRQPSDKYLGKPDGKPEDAAELA